VSDASIVRSFYAAMGKGELDAALAHVAPDCAWTEMDGLAAGRTYTVRTRSGTACSCESAASGTGSASRWRTCSMGAGTAGLHLALPLQQRGLSPTLYAERPPDEVRAGRLPNTVAHHHRTRGRTS
jgi:hypothetical protein